MKARSVSATEQAGGNPGPAKKKSKEKKKKWRSPANLWAGKVEIVGDIVNGDPDLWDVARGEWEPSRRQ